MHDAKRHGRKRDIEMMITKNVSTNQFNKINFILLSTLIMNLFLFVDTTRIQPSSCEYSEWVSLKKTANCSNRNLSSVPADLELNVWWLDLSHNSIVKLYPYIFKTVGQLNIFWLSLKNCSLTSIESTAFDGLITLDTLILSQNNLRYLPKNVFDSLINLKSLYINGNKLQIVYGRLLLNLHQLQILDLSENAISETRNDSFLNNRRLLYIDLNNNSLTRAAFSFEENVTLPTISLYNNPWNCDCKLFSLKQQAKEFVTLLEPKCSTPDNLSGVYWKVIEDEKFACRPTVRDFYIIDNNLYTQVYCKVYGDPMPNVTLIVGDEYFHSDDVNDTYLDVIYNIKEKEIELTLNLTFIKKINTNEIACLATNVAGRTNINLSISFDNMLIVITFVALTFIVISCILIYKVISRRRTPEENVISDEYNIYYFALER